MNLAEYLSTLTKSKKALERRIVASDERNALRLQAYLGEALTFIVTEGTRPLWADLFEELRGYSAEDWKRVQREGREAVACLRPVTVQSDEPPSQPAPPVPASLTEK